MGVEEKAEDCGLGANGLGAPKDGPCGSAAGALGFKSISVIPQTVKLQSDGPRYH